jgi:hypothetical protein
MHRPQTAHWLWTSQPQVLPNEYPEFGLQGRGGRIDSWYGIVLVLASFLIQIASLMFWLPLEIHQMETLGYPTFVIALRFRNIAAFALGKMDAWGLRKLSRKIRGTMSISRHGIFCISCFTARSRASLAC